jgi:hypothetical protein
MADAKESSRRLQGAVSTSEGWWTIASAGLVFVIIAASGRIGHGVDYGYVPAAVVPVAILVGKYRRAAARVHPRNYHLLSAMAGAWALIVLAAKSRYWIMWDPPGPRQVWLACAAALVAALPLALVGGRLVAGGRSR